MADKLAWALARLDIETYPDRHGLRDLADFCEREDSYIDALASAKSFRFEAQANHIRHWMEHAPHD